MRVASTWSTMPDRRVMIVNAGVASDRLLHPGADERRLRLDQRHRLALHIRTHQRAVCVVVLKNGIKAAATETSCFWRDVDQIDILRARHDEIPPLRQFVRSATIRPSASVSTLAWAMAYRPSSIAER